ncbi:MAG TPA: DUF4230 domain-containing protein [Gemmatimonadales bacterium]|nr:DUF4230 domain-containing protein [Gemmatimonadales bacterium]
MADPEPGAAGTRRPHTLLVALVLLVAALFAAELALRAAGGAFAVPVMHRLLPRAGRTTISQSVVVERMRSVAKLLTSETTARDVVVYRNRWLGSTKRSLVVVTGTVLAGVDLDAGSEVRVDPAAHRVHIVLPHATVLAVDVTDLRTYDEQRGLWNPFHPADRDSIYQLARSQLATSARELGTLQHAEASARQLLTALIGTEGYGVDVTFTDAASLKPRLEAPVEGSPLPRLPTR